MPQDPVYSINIRMHEQRTVHSLALDCSVPLQSPASPYQRLPEQICGRQACIRFVLLYHQQRGCTPTAVIKATATGAAAHLDVLPRGQPTEAATVKFACVGEDHRLRWHV